MVEAVETPRREKLQEHAKQAKKQAITLAWEANGDPDIDAAASHLIQAFHFLNRAANK